jgi:hypothetical protein
MKIKDIVSEAAAAEMAASSVASSMGGGNGFLNGGPGTLTRTGSIKKSKKKKPKNKKA